MIKKNDAGQVGKVSVARYLLITVLVVAAGLAGGLALMRAEQSLVSIIQEGDHDALEKRLDAGADPDVVDTEVSPISFFLSSKLLLQTTPLIEASRNERAEMVRLLLDAGADPNFTPSGKDVTPALFWALRRNNVQIGEMLLEAGAKLDTRTVPGGRRAVFEYAVEKRRFALLVLCSRHLDCTRHTALMAVARDRHKAFDESSPFYPHYLTELLRQCEAAPDDAYTRIHRGRDVFAVAELTDPLGSPSDWTLLTWAIVNKRDRVVEGLVQEQRDGFVRTAWGATPLMAAAQVGNLELVKRLLQLGEDPRAADDMGRTARYYAEYEGFEEVAEYLASVSK